VWATGLAFALAFAVFTGSAEAQTAPYRNGLAMHGEPALPAGFDHLPYVDPAAPQGGQVVHGVLGSFDSLNPYIVRGTPPTGVIANNVVETLMARSFDEPFTLYGLLAESVAVPEDRSSVEFRLNPAAKFSDGTPVTAEDVIFSWDLLKTRGRPNHRTYYSKVAKAEALDPRTVRFDLAGANDRELPLILGLMPILPKHATDPESFEAGGLKPLVASGPYVVTKVDAGRSLTLTRNAEYWGKGLPVTRGWGNFAEIRYDYYRDANTMLEAFRKGLYDVRPETDPQRWVSGFDGPALRDGRIVKDELESRWPKPISAFVFNTRRELFRDVRVREAIGLLFDFEWVNANLFNGAYARTGSFFQGSELSALGRPADTAERALLAPFPGAVRADVLEGTYAPPKSDGSGRDREKLRAAFELLRAAGWEFRNGALTNKDGAVFKFEILVRSREQERIALAFTRNIAQAGIKAEVRQVDAVQFETRLMSYDFDMTQYAWDNSLSPGNEQSFYWGSAGRATNGTRNYMGATEPAIDSMIAAILQARTREELVVATRTLDRVLISGFYVVPLFHLPKRWIARWSHIGRPQITPLYGPVPETWWRVSGQ
jgi:peptide/nickel transport system substrate-binding protein